MIAVRVPEPLYRQIKEAAKESKQTMSEAMAWGLTRAFEWQAAFYDAKRLSTEFQQRMKEDLKMEMRRHGWRPLHGSPYWLPPEVAPHKDTGGFVGTKKVDPLEVLRTELERCIAIIKAVQPQEEPQ